MNKMKFFNRSVKVKKEKPFDLLPDEMIICLLSFVDVDSLLNCRIVCKIWKSFIDAYVFQEKASRENKFVNNGKGYYSFSQIDSNTVRKLEFPWYVFYAICKYDPFHRNLVRNHCGQDNFKHWAFNDMWWIIEKNPVGADPLPDDPDFDGQTSCFVSTYKLCSKSQTILFKNHGLTNTIMKLLKPDILVSEWYSGRCDCGCKYIFKASVHDRTNMVLELHDYNNILLQWQANKWTKISHIFKNQSNASSISIYHAGVDTQYWRGHYGSKISGTVLKVMLPIQLKDDATILKKSLFLPITKFKSRLNVEQTIQRDSNIFKTCGFSDLYSWQREHMKNEEFILHDGPPYANGSAHIGHALNKILKDITIRSKLINGNKINYIPGWDCHGLPIELKAEKIHGNKWKNYSPLKIRQNARKYASKEIEKQKKVFKSWGILADWEKNCYYTFDKNYIQKQIQQFYELYKKGSIYRDLKPVYWSPSSKSALAEAELEYNTNHQSKSVTVKLELCPSTFSINLSNSEIIYALIWTTTPWTLPGNVAVVYSSNLMYSFVKIFDIPGIYLLATDLIQNLSTKINKSIEIISTIKGNELSSLKYKSLRFGEDDKPFLAGDHVTTDKGTGLVHTAPAYGHDDFLIALKHKIPIECHVDECGVFMPQTWSELINLAVLDEGNEMVCTLLSNKILHTEMYEHSYPYDWRTKLPVIIRASKQWFLDTGTIKKQSIECLKDIRIYPELSGSRNALLTLIEKRPYWCISRQRSWGVPIPVLYDESDNAIIDEKLLNNYYTLLEETGQDFWWIYDVQKLASNTSHNSEKLKKGLDILDIWFDSGISWSCVLGNNTIADLYLEGVDQCTGWFQASLMSSIALRNASPFRSLFVHGFVVDENGRKMSKSIGNVIDPQDIINGKYDQSITGVDILRWWVAKHGSHQTNIPVTKETMNNTKQSIDKIRLILRFLLGSFNNIKEHHFIHGINHLRYLDKYIILELKLFENEMNMLYNTFQYNKVCIKLLHFITNTISGLYVHHIKDRLYCDPIESNNRLACTATLQVIFENLLKHIAPILPHLAEEAFSFYPLRKTTFFKTPIMNLNEIVIPDSEKVISVIEKGLEVKSKVSNILHGTNSLKQSLIIAAPDETHNLLQHLHPKNSDRKSDLIELLQVNSIELTLSNIIDVKTIDSKGILCKRCRRWSAEKQEELCKRCEKTITIFNSK